MSTKKRRVKDKESTSHPEDAANESSFSPVKSALELSPEKCIIQGSARKLKDAAADWHNSILKWKQLNSTGMQTIQKMANMKLEKILSADNENEEVNSAYLMPELEHLCDQLRDIIHSMDKVVVKMKGLCGMIQGIQQLERYQTGQDANILFQTWSLKEFEDTFTELHEMYSKELDLKKTVGENVAHARDRSLLMVYTSSWLHQPYIEEKEELLLEGLLLETGHKIS